MKKYEEYFCLFKDDVKKINAKFTVLYIPSDDYSGKAYRRHKICRTFFITLCKKYNIDFIDLTNEFFKYKSEIITLLPENGHLSRFGNILVANKLKNYILKYSQYRSNYIFHDVKRPKILGDLPPNLNEIWNILPIMPYRVITNSQGFRMKKDITFPRKRKRLRILILGDSYTFGPYVGNHNTYPGLLQKMCSFCDIINAGICGYTICHELSLFEERAQYTEPDIVILQVLDNDIYGLTTYKLFQFQRNGEVVRKNLMDEERDLINSLKIKN
jgi:lysophospholipase L1-like esterase